MVVTELRDACAQVAAEARSVRIDTERIPAYAASLDASSPACVAARPDDRTRRGLASFWLTLDAINFGSGWFPRLVKPAGLSGYRTISAAWRTHVDRHGLLSPRQLRAIEVTELAAILGQDRAHPLMDWFAQSLNDLGAHLIDDHHADPLELIGAAAGSASALVEILAEWRCFADVSTYGDIRVPFLKRAQITAADLARCGAADLGDLDALTMFADNLVPHVLRLDGILHFDPALVSRIDAEELIEHGSGEEVEIRACAVHAVELLTAARGRVHGGSPTAAQLDQLLWERGQGPAYKAQPRHRSRCWAY